MITEKNILTRIRAADDNPPASAYATEIPSNEYVTGNLLSKSVYNQTKEEDNGNGNFGTHTSGEFDKAASHNAYLEKIAQHGWVKDWGRRLIKNVKEAEPLTQLGIATGAVVGIGKAQNLYSTKKTHRTQHTLEERSLKTLQSINRRLNKVVIAPPSKEA
jgi:hypothetical protein